MRHALLVAFAGAASLAAQSPAPVVVEQVVAPDTVWSQQATTITVRVGVEPSWFAGHAVPLLAQPLDLPVVLALPWAADAALACELLPNERGVSAVVDGRVVRLLVESRTAADERTWYRLDARCRPQQPGAMRIEPATVRYAYAEQFEQDLVNGRHAVDHHEATVASPACELTVRPLPSPAPVGFFGAVGEFVVEAAVSPSVVQVGETTRFTVTLRGDGNLAKLSAPGWQEIAGMRSLGVVERREADAREFTFDLLQLREGEDVAPGLALPVFSPREERFVTLRTPPVPLRVQLNPAEAALPEGVRNLLAADRAAQPGAAWWSRLVPVWIGLLLAVGVTLRAGRIRRRRRQLLAAGAGVNAALVSSPNEAAAAFASLCSFALRTAVADAEALRVQLERRRVAPALRDEACALLAALQEVRFGGPSPSPDRVKATLDHLVAWGAPR